MAVNCTDQAAESVTELLVRTEEEVQPPAELGAEGGIRSDHFSNKLMAHDLR